MTRRRHWMIGAASVACLIAANGVAAQTYYVGAEVGGEQVSFPTDYAFASGGPNESYDNRANGTSGGVLAGYRWEVAPGVSIALQGRLSVSDTAWKMDLADQTSFKYAIPVNAAVSLLPIYRVSDKVALFVEAGVALGKIQERKSAVSTSMYPSLYDVRKWQPGGIAGVGISLAMDEKWSLRIGYRRTWFKEFSYDSHLADGTQVETVSASPVQSVTSLGLIRDF